MRKLLLILLFVAGICYTETGFAQGFKMPNASSGQTIIQEFGLGTITLKYSRPNIKGRKIFGTGTLLPYGEVWRTGANNATTIQFSDDVTIEGNKIPAGEYGLFSIPGRTEWTIIMNKTAKQWGAYQYKQEDDFIRFKVKPTTIITPIETFSIQFTDVMPGSCDLGFMWERTAVKFHLTTDYDARVMAGIEEAMKGSKKPYYQAIQYYYDNNKDMSLALGWATELEKSDPRSYVYKVWKARVELKLGDKKAAIATATEGAGLAREGKSDEYTRLNEAVIAQAKK